MLTKVCTAPSDVRKLMLEKLEEGRSKRAASAELTGRRDKRARDPLFRGQGHGPSFASSSTQLTGSSAAGGDDAGGASTRAPGGIDRFFSCVSAPAQERTATLCGRWVFREGLPFRVVETDFFKERMKAINPAFSTPSRLQKFNSMLRNGYKLAKAVVDH